MTSRIWMAPAATLKASPRIQKITSSTIKVHSTDILHAGLRPLNIDKLPQATCHLPT